MSDVIIRERSRLDLEQCISALAAVHDADRYPQVWPADPARWLNPAGRLNAWVAPASDGTIAGHILLHHPRPSQPTETDTSATSPAAEISRLFVVPTARRRGIATQLIQHAQHWSTRHGYTLLLNVADDQRSAAITLYENTGWRHTHTTTATWTTADGQPVNLRHYTTS